MASYKPRVIALTKRQGQTFGFFLRVEQGEEGHLIRCLEMGGPAELAGLKDGDRILRINKTYVDNLPHSQVVELVRESGATVTFHVLDEAAYKQAKANGVDLADPPQARPVVNGVAGHTPKPKLCYLVKGSTGYGFSLRSVNGEQGVHMTDLALGGVAERAGVKVQDRLVEVNGENVESLSHDNIVEMIKAAGGTSILFLLVDEETDRHYKSQGMALTAQRATVKHLPHKPRIADMQKGSDGYGYFLKVLPNMAGHFVRDIDSGSPAEKAGLKDMDRVVAVNGQEVDDCSHQQVVDHVRQSGGKCCLLVVDAETDKMYKLGGVSPMLFWEEMRGSILPPSYPEALAAPAPVYVSTPADKQEEEELKPKLCKMEKSLAGYGFHLNGIHGVFGQYIKEVVEGGAADRAGLKDGYFVIEVNGVNVEQSTHEEAVALIRNSSSSLALLVADKATYEQLKAKGAAIAPQLHLAPTSAQEPRPATLDEVIEEAEREEERQDSEEKRKTRGLERQDSDREEVRGEAEEERKTRGLERQDSDREEVRGEAEEERKTRGLERQDSDREEERGEAEEERKTRGLERQDSDREEERGEAERKEKEKREEEREEAEREEKEKKEDERQVAERKEKEKKEDERQEAEEKEEKASRPSSPPAQARERSPSVSSSSSSDGEIDERL